MKGFGQSEHPGGEGVVHAHGEMTACPRWSVVGSTKSAERASEGGGGYDASCTNSARRETRRPSRAHSRQQHRGPGIAMVLPRAGPHRHASQSRPARCRTPGAAACRREPQAHQTKSRRQEKNTSTTACAPRKYAAVMLANRWSPDVDVPDLELVSCVIRSTRRRASAGQTRRQSSGRTRQASAAGGPAHT